MPSKFDNQILNSFLRELLGGKRPPDLSESILRAHAERHSAERPTTSGWLEDADGGDFQSGDLRDVAELRDSDAGSSSSDSRVGPPGSQQSRFKFKMVGSVDDPNGSDVESQESNLLAASPLRTSSQVDEPAAHSDGFETADRVARSGWTRRRLSWVISLAAVMLVAVSVSVTLLAVHMLSDGTQVVDDRRTETDPGGSRTDERVDSTPSPGIPDREVADGEVADPQGRVPGGESEPAPRIVEGGSVPPPTVIDFGREEERPLVVESRPSSALPVLPIPSPESTEPLSSLPLVAADEIVLPPSYRLREVADAEIQVDELKAWIDMSLEATWSNHGIEPANRVTDQAWLNRVTYRLIGETPAAAEVEFLRSLLWDEGREAVVRHLISSDQFRPRFLDQLAKGLAHQLIGVHPQLNVSSDEYLTTLQEYLRDGLQRNKPFDQVAYELISAVGSPDRDSPEFNPAASYLTLLAKRFGPEMTNWTGHISETFLNQHTRCNQCHDSADGQLAQGDFWQLYSFFTQTRIERAEGEAVRLANRDYLPGMTEEDQTRLARYAPVFYLNPQGEPQMAFPGLGDDVAVGESGLVKEFDRRTELAWRVARSEQWQQALVDHLFTLFLNSPLQPHDRPGPVELQTLQQKLAEQLAASGYKIEPMVEAITLSRAFELAVDGSRDDTIDNPMLGTAAYFSRYYDYRVSNRAAQRTLAIVDQAYRSSQEDRIEMRGLLAQRAGDPLRERPRLLRVTEGLPPKQAAWGQLPPNSEVLERIATSTMSDRDKIHHLFLAALQRPASQDELDQAEEIIRRSSDPQQALQDIWWALFNSYEYRFPGGIR